MALSNAGPTTMAATGESGAEESAIQDVDVVILPPFGRTLRLLQIGL